MSILFNNPLLGASGQGPSADLGDTIEQSLRFDGGSNLSRTFGTPTSQNKWTYSCWIKRGDVGSAMAAGLSTQAGSYGEESNLEFNAGADLLAFGSSTGSSWTTFLQSDQVFRDPSAWYHLMAVLDTDQANSDDRWKWYVNGTQVTSFSTNTRSSQGANHYTNKAQSHTIGSRVGGGLKFDGQMAMVIFVDGQALDPTDFGRSNNDGVWVPVDYSGTYGNNGFHLTFDSSQTNGIGHDSSGNGNHFTATGFDTGDVALWSSMLYSTSASSPDFDTTTKSFTSAATFGFDGSTSGTFYVGAGNRWVWRPNTAIPNVTLIEVYTGSGNTHWVNESAVGNSTTGGTYNTVYSGAAITLSNLAGQFGATGSGSSGFAALRINGVVYVDNTDNDVDYLDTPTSNYATLNPLNYALATMSNANLAFRSNGSGAWQFRPASVGGQSTGKWYWEARAVGAGTSLMASIINDQYEKLNTSDVYPGQGAGVGTGGWSLYGSNGRLYRNGVDQVASEGLAYGTDDILMFALDLENGAWWAGQNGTWYKSATTAEIEAGTTTNAIDTGTLSGEFWPGFVAQGSTANGWDVNFGQMPFVYTQPSGFNAWQTNNLPEPTIKDGKEHFGILTYTGDGATTSGQTVTDTDAVPFTPDLVWIKKRGDNGGATAVREHILIDSVRGKDGSYYWNLSSNDNLAETSSDHVSAIGEGSITVHDITSGTINQNLNTFVAWCWKAGGTAVTNTDGTNSNTVSVSANQNAGFSIVTYTGETSNNPNTIGHGLNAIPEFIIVKRRDATENWAVYHVSLGNDRSLELHDTTGQSASSSAFWNSTTPTSSVFSVGNGGATNEAGGTYVAYVWAPKEGYSKFGSYTGGGSGSAPNYDGTFVYLGFRPAWLLIKRSNAAGDSWILLDSTRDPNNFAFRALKPDTTDNEISSGDQFAIDFLSNGFKCRSANAAINLSGATYVYFAFAESPFGGENAPPATAR